jgi:tetratricopeptide (TPR) repeat protein
VTKGRPARAEALEGGRWADFRRRRPVRRSFLRAGKPDRALELAEARRPRASASTISIRGRALKDRASTPAIQALLEGNKIYNSDTRLLNALGFCFYKTGQKKEALGALAASLRLNPEQKDVEELRGRVEKELK